MLQFQIAPEAVLFPEMCAYLEGHGFRCMDMYDLLYRPRDNAFWQMDMLFMKADRDEFFMHKIWLNDLRSQLEPSGEALEADLSVSLPWEEVASRSTLRLTAIP
jgi:hypothetical protein